MKGMEIEMDKWYCRQKRPRLIRRGSWRAMKREKGKVKKVQMTY